jgi:hypothetical protein
MREELAMNKIRDVGELYALADKCARAEEGRKLPGEGIGAGGGSESEDAVPAKKGRARNNRKRKGKAVLAVEQSGSDGGAKKARVGSSGKDIAACPNCQALAAADKPDGSDKQYCKISGESNLSSNRKPSMNGATRRGPQTVPVGPARNALPEEVAAARPSSSKEIGLRAAATRMKQMMMIWVTMSPASMSFKKPQKSCVLTVALPCTPPTAS